jgi:hypothetical protein
MLLRGKVIDQYLAFIAPSPSLFSLLPPPTPAPSIHANQPPAIESNIPTTTYAILNSPSSTEQQIEEEIERVASGLFSAIATLGVFPLRITRALYINGHQDMSLSFVHRKGTQRRWSRRR